MSRFDEAQKAMIAERYTNGGEPMASIARAFGVSPRTIGRVLDSMGVDRSARVAKPVTDRVEQERGDELDEDIEYNYEFVCTPNMITISRESVDRKHSDSETITIDDDRFNSIFDSIASSRGSKESLENAFVSMSKKVFIESQTFGNIRVDVERGSLTYKYPGSGEVIDFSSRLTNRLIEAIKNKEDLDGLINFTESLAWNPDPDIISRLYDFIEATDVVITPEGLVRCYKKIGSNFMDLYSGTIDNSPGKTPKVKRSYVDSNANNTCSRGLHVCSWSYLNYYGSGSDVIVAVDVHAEDFVAIPRDYNDAKARVCEYHVLKQVTSPLYD